MIYDLGTKGRMREEEKERGRKKEIKVERERMREREQNVRETERGGKRETEKTCQKLGKYLILYKAEPDLLKIPSTRNNIYIERETETEREKYDS